MKSLLRKSGYIGVFAVIASYALITLRGPQGVPALLERRRQVRELQEINASLMAENQQKRERIERLKSSKAEQELEIRDRLKLAKPGETQFILPEKPKN